MYVKGYKMNKVTSFKQFFFSLEEETLVSMAINTPNKLKLLCMFLSLDLQLEEEEQTKNGKHKNS